jgi:hypothetical protein
VATLDPEEKAFQERLENAVLEVMTDGRITSDDLSHWNLRSFAFKNIDAHISRACDDDEKPHLERLFLLLMIYKCLNRLLEPGKAPAKRPLSLTEQLYREQQKAKAKPANRRTTKRVSRSALRYRAMIAAMSPEELEAFRTEERERQKAMRARKTGTLKNLFIRAAGFSLTPSRLGRSFGRRSDALAKAFLLTPRDMDVPGA